MRRLFAVQFEVAPVGAAHASDTAEDVLRSTAAWISEWYAQPTHKHISIDFPASGGCTTPCPGHEISVNREASEEDGASHSVVSWSYPENGDGNLLWHSRCEISSFGGMTEFSLELLLESIQFYIAPLGFAVHRPNLIPELLRSFVCTYGGERLSAEPCSLSAGAVPEFVRTHLTLRERRLPIVLVSPDGNSEKALVDPVKLAIRLAGTATVFVLDGKEATYGLRNAVGKINSCYNGAVRLYWPGFDPQKSYSPLYMPERVKDLGDGLADVLFRQLAAISSFRFVPGPVTVDALDALRERKTREQESVRKAAQDRGEYAQLLQEDDKVIARLEEENRLLKEEKAKFQAAAQDLQATIIEMQKQGKVKEMELAEGDADLDPEPRTVEEAVKLAKRRFPETLYFMKSALKSAKDSPFKDASRVLHALEAMNKVCLELRRSKDQVKSVGAPEVLFDREGFEYKARSGDRSKGKWNTEYEAKWGEKIVSFEQHLALGDGKPDRCLRIHFHLDKERMQYIIKTVGRHPTNTRT